MPQVLEWDTASLKCCSGSSGGKVSSGLLTEWTLSNCKKLKIIVQNVAREARAQNDSTGYRILTILKGTRNENTRITRCGVGSLQNQQLGRLRQKHCKFKFSNTT